MDINVPMSLYLDSHGDSEVKNYHLTLNSDYELLAEILQSFEIIKKEQYGLALLLSLRFLDTMRGKCVSSL